MGEKQSKKNEGGEKKSGEIQKKEDGKLSVILKSDFHCEGCVTKIVKAVKSIQGVEKVTCDVDSNKLTVIGKVDPVMLREKVEQKTHKHVELVSPLPKKDAKGKDGGGNGGGEETKKQNNKENNNNNNKNSKENKKGGGEEKKIKEKEPPTTTAVLKLHLHCQGCIQKIYKIVTKFKGYKELKIDKQKDLVTVTGSMDMKELVETLKKHLKKEVEVLPPKKEGGEKKEKGGDNASGGGGGEKGKGGGKAKGKGGEGGGGEGKGKGEEGGGIGGGEMIMGNVGNNGMQMMQQQVQFGYPYPYMYGPVYPGDQFQNPYTVSVHAPQLFSDENPNACSVM